MKTLFKITNEAERENAAGGRTFKKKLEDEAAARDWVIATLNLSENWKIEKY